MLQEVDAPQTGGKTQIAFVRDATVDTAALASLISKVGMKLVASWAPETYQR